MHRRIVAEISKTTNVPKFLAALEALVELAKLSGGRVGKAILATLCHALIHKYPRIRKAAADGLGTCLLLLDLNEPDSKGEGEGENEDEGVDEDKAGTEDDGFAGMAVDEIVSSVAWDADSEEDQEAAWSAIAEARKAVMRRLGMGAALIAADPYSGRDQSGAAPRGSSIRQSRSAGLGTGTYADLVRDVYGS